MVVGHDQVSAAGSALIKGEAGVRRVSSCLY